MAIDISINGKDEQLDREMTVGELLAIKRISPEVVTVELNDKIIHRDDYGATELKAGDRVEFVFFMGGGK